MVRNREAFGQPWDDMPVFGTSAARFNDDGVTALYQHLLGLLAEKGLPAGARRPPRVGVRGSTGLSSVVPAQRGRALAEIAAAARGYTARTAQSAALAP